MNWDAIGAIGEIVGAIAVVVSLGILAYQIRTSTRTMAESNRLERALAMDRHSDTIGRWRGRLMEHPDLTAIWLTGSTDGELSEVDEMRLNNLWIDLVNVQRSNFIRARTVGEEGLATHAARSIAVETSLSATFRRQWEAARPWSALSSPEFTAMVDAEHASLVEQPDTPFRAGSRYHHADS